MLWPRTRNLANFTKTIQMTFIAHKLDSRSQLKCGWTSYAIFIIPRLKLKYRKPLTPTNTNEFPLQDKKIIEFT